VSEGVSNALRHADPIRHSNTNLNADTKQLAQ